MEARDGVREAANRTKTSQPLARHVIEAVEEGWDGGQEIEIML